MNCTRYSAIFSLLIFASALGYSQEKIDPLRDIKHNGDATTYIDGTGHYTVPAGGAGTANNGVVDSTGGTYNTACGIVLEERASGTTTVNLPAVATGCSGMIIRGTSAGVITIAPPGGVAYDGITTQLGPGMSAGWWYDGTGYHSTHSGIQITSTFVGVLANAQITLWAPMTTAMTIPSSCAGSYMKAATAATASAAFTIVDVTTSTTLCTATFAISGTTATFSGSGGSIAVGDVIKITGPSTADATLATVGAAIYATR